MPNVRPTLTNRGPAGLLTKVESGEAAAKSLKEMEDETISKAPKNHITPGLKALAVSIAKLIPDPNNAREHPERNMRAIMLSLAQFGQAKPLVVRKTDNVVIAGNGTLEAAKLLGWTKIAANVVDYSSADAIGLGLADNRTAELAKWNFETVARLDKLLQEAEQCPVGWTSDELEVLRAAEWTPPPITGNTFDPHAPKDKIVSKAIELIKTQYEGGEKFSDEQALQLICQEWLQQQESASATDSSQEVEENGVLEG